MAVERSTQTSFREYLQSELVARCKKNPHYSLRAFAQFLEVEPSSLSQMLRGKRKITDKMKARISSKLGLGPIELQQFDSTVNYSPVTLDIYEITSEWYYFAIMELLLTESFKPDHKWIAKSLGLSNQEAKEAIDRLIRVGFITIDDEGNWKDTCAGNLTTLDKELTTPAHIKMQRQLLDKASEAMGKFSIDERSQTGMTMAISKDRLPKAKEMIIKFQRELCAYLEDGSQEDVYHLGISLFPLTSGEIK